MEEDGEGTADTTISASGGSLVEDTKTMDQTKNKEGDEYFKIKELLRRARYRTLEDQSPVADDATNLENVAKTVLAYLRRGDDNNNKFGLGSITSTLDISGKRKKVDCKVAGLLDLHDFLPVLEQFFTCEGNQVELNCLAAKIYSCVVEGIGCNNSLAWKIDHMDFLKHLFIMLSSNEEVLMEQAVHALAETALNMYLRPSLLSCAPLVFPQLQVFITTHPYNLVVRSPAICSIVANLLVAPREIRLSVEKAYKKRDNSFTAIMLRGGIGPTKENEGTFVLDDADVRSFLNENLTFKKHFPTIGIVQTGLPLMEVLLQSDNDKTLLHTLHALTYLLRSFKVNRKSLFLKRQLCRNLVSIFERSDDELVLSFVCLSIEYLVGLNREDMMLFLQNVKGTKGLRYYWKTMEFTRFASALDDFRSSGISYVTILDFLRSAATVIQDSSPNSSGISAIMDCGLHITFLNLLKPSTFISQKEVRVVAISAIHSILGSLSNQSVHILCESQVIQFLDHVISAITTDFGKHSPYSNALAAGILGHLVNESCDRRDKAFKGGAMPALVKVLRMVASSMEPGPTSNVMSCLDKMVTSKPSPKLEDIKDLVGETCRLWRNMPPLEVSVLADVRILLPLKFLAVITKFGVDGINLIVNGGEEKGKVGDDNKAFLLRRIISLSANSNKNVQTYALEVVLGICKGTTQHRRMVVEKGILKKFKIILKEGTPVPRRISLNCLDAFITEGILTFEQKMFLHKELSPLAKAEEKLMLSETHLAAQFVNEKIIRLFYQFPPAPPKNYY